MKRKIVECSSLYAIDFAEVIYNLVDEEDNIEYILFINDSADTKSEYREFISRLALPTLKWDIDPQGQLRQIHIPIEKSNKEKFIESVKSAIDSYSSPELLKNKENYFHILLEKLAERLFKCSDNGIECYKELIKLMIELISGKTIDILNFGDIRETGDKEKARNFLLKMKDCISELPPNNYQFLKGGKIEVFVENKWIAINAFSNKNGIELYGINKKIYSFNQLYDSERIRFRGPLESVFLCQYGILIDLPWYLEANISVDVWDKCIGEEYISPISVSSVTRASKKIKGKGMRLIPSGYSLIEYDSDNVVMLLRKIYKEDKSICLDDLDDWKFLVNNYPVSHQKIAKSQTSVHELCNMLLEERFKELTGNTFLGEISYKNYVTLGKNLVDVYVIIKFLRLLSNKKSPYFKKINLLNCIYFEESYDNSLCMFYKDIIKIVNKTEEFFGAFDYKIEYVIKCKKEIEDNQNIFLRNIKDNISHGDQFYHKVSKIERTIKSCLYTYYELATFISGVLLKANIFSAFCALGFEYKDCVKRILQQREHKKLYFEPIYVKGGKLEKHDKGDFI